MRAMLALAGAVVCVGSASWASSETFPYTAYVQSEKAQVHSGPGLRFYVTDLLVQGTEVEVYRHDDVGWCAIRPPEGSFSWVERAKLRPTGEPDVAEVTTDDAVSFVGTRFGDLHHVKHVALSRGELVEVRGIAVLREPRHPSPKSWAKISPPAGEFRWIRSRHLTRKTNGRATEAGDEANAGTGPAERPPRQAPEASATENPVALVSHESEADATGNDDQGIDDRPIDDSLLPRVPPQDGPPAFVDRSDLRFRSEPGEEGDEVSVRELDEIDIQLSLTVSRDAPSWGLDDLRSRVEAVIDSCRSTAQRERAREVLGKIVQFQDIKRRHERLLSPRNTTTELQPNPSLIAQSDSARASRLFGMGGRRDQSPSAEWPYDGAGWLMRVITSRPGVPRYALTDQSGKILQFVSPAPGVNLRRFEREQIGIIGRRGYVPSLRRPHLTAERIVVLNRHLR